MEFISKSIVACYDTYGRKLTLDEQDVLKYWVADPTVSVDFHELVRKPYVKEDGLLVPQCTSLYCDSMFKNRTCEGLFVSQKYAISNDYKYSLLEMSSRRCFREGFCYMNLFVGLAKEVPNDDQHKFVSFLNLCPAVIGPWPEGKTLARIIEHLTTRIPQLKSAVIPNVSVCHETRASHVADQRGPPQGWCIVRAATLADLQFLCMNTDLSEYKFGGGVEVAYKHMKDCIKFANKSKNPCTTFNKLVMTDTTLAATLLLSPATLSRLNDWFSVDSNAANLLMAVEATGVDAIARIHILDRARKGIQIHFSGDDYEKCVHNFHQQVLEFLNTFENVDDLKAAVVDLYHTIAKEKNHYILLEKKILGFSEYHFQKECGIGFFSRSVSWLIAIIASLISGGGKYQWTESFKLRVHAMSLLICWFATTAFNLGYHCAYWWFGWFTLKNLVLTSMRLWLNYSFGRNYTHHFWMCFVSCFAMIVTLYVGTRQLREKNTVLQSSDKEKKVTSLIALILLVVHLFDCDLALRLSSSFNSVVRLSQYLSEETRNIIPKILGTSLQAISEDEEDLVTEISLEMDPEEIQAHDLRSHRETFGMWIDSRTLSTEPYTRELQYGGSEIHYVVTPSNQQEIAREMVNTQRAWNSLVGSTGSGKSTRLPVLYLESLRLCAGRNKRILICEPSQATTVNVASGISSFYGQQVYYKHRAAEQIGDLSIQVMTYGSALMRAVYQPDFIKTFDAVFLDESHCVQAHNLAFEALLDRHDNIRKFYMSATPRVGHIDYQALRRFNVTTIKAENTDVDHWFKRQGSGDAYDVTDKGNVILVFLSGRNECEKIAQKVTASGGAFAPFRGMALHSLNFVKAYNKIVQASNNDEKVMIFCTNILETGVTLNADVVVDFGFTMRPSLDLLNKTMSLQRCRATDFERHQRIGRVGRVKDGYALLLGKTYGGRPSVSPDVVFESALYSFLYDLDIYASECLDTSWLSSITREQAKTMLSFQLPVFVTKDLVASDGSVRKEACSFFRQFLLNDTELKVKDFSVPAHVYGSWPTSHDMLMRCYRGDEFTEEMRKLAHQRVSFCTYHFDERQVVDFVAVCESYRTQRNLHTSPKMVRKVLMRVTPETVNQCYIVAKALKARLHNMLQSLISVQHKVQSSTLVQCLGFAKKMSADQMRRIETLRNNIREVDKHIDALQRYDTLIKCDGVEAYLEGDEFQSVTKHVTLQVDGENDVQHLAQMLEVETNGAITLKDILAARGDKIAFAFLAVSGAYLLSEVYGRVSSFVKNQSDGVVTLEGKGKRYDRSKRMESTHVNEAFDMFNRLKEKKGKVRKEKPLKSVSSLLTKTNPFVNFYDIGGDENVENAVFKTLEGVVVHETQTPCEDVKDLQRIIQLKNMEKPAEKWADDVELAEQEMVCEIQLRDGRNARINLQPHKSRIMTRTGGLVGYPEHEGELRQVGATKLEMTSSIPLSHVDVSIASMIGTVHSKGSPRMNVILYGDFLVFPAHVQTLTLPLTVRFQHAVFDYHGGEVMRFDKCDLILMKRPNVVPPVKVSAKVGIITQAQHVQLVYRVPGTFKAIVSGSDMCTPFENGRWTYAISTKDGMCGSAVVTTNQGLLVGIHVAANELLRRNFMEPFSQDMVDVLQKKQPFSGDSEWFFNAEECGYLPGELARLQAHYDWDLKFDPERYNLELMNHSAAGFGNQLPHCPITSPLKPITYSLSNGGFELIGQSKSNLCSKHKIVGESVYWKQFKAENPQLVKGIEDYENFYAPSALTREAYYKDVSKYDRRLKAYPDVKRLEHARMMVEHDLRNSGMQTCKTRNAYQVLADLEVNTAAGALYACKKRILLHPFSDSELLLFAQNCYGQLCQGSTMGVWNGSLKDELRPVEKVMEQKTRVFTASPITSLLGAKFVVDDFNQQFYSTHCKARHTVGINPWCGGWDKLARFLGNGEMPFYVSGDGSRFDSSLDPILFDQVLKMRKAFHDPTDSEAFTALDNLYQEIVFTPILLENGQIVMKKVGNPSGQPSTVVDNTLILMMCFYYCALAVSDDEQWIRENFLFVCNGDDQKCAFTQDFVDKGGLNFEQQLKQCGLSYEFDEVTNDMTEYPYMSLTMIRRKFNGNECIGFLLSPERIVAINQWMTKKGILGVCQRAFPAMLHSYNDPWLFNIMHAYLVWLLLSFEDEIILQMEQTGETCCYIEPWLVHLLHFGGTSLQVDSEKEEEEPQQQQPSNTQIVQWTIPNIKKTPKVMGFRAVGGKHRATHELFKSVPRNVRDLFRNDIATDEQFLKWESEVRNDYDITTDTAWNTVLLAWCLFCANNGASEKLNPHDMMTIPTGHNSNSEVQIAGFLRAAQSVGLRKIMRKLSRETSAALKQLGEMTKWGLQRGIRENRMIPYAFDFYVVDEMTPVWAREQLSAVKHSALGVGVQNSVILDAKHHSVVTTNVPENEQKQESSQRFKAPLLR